MSSIADKLEVSKNALEGLLDYANEKTQKADSNIGEAIKTLVDGYGQGGGEFGSDFPMKDGKTHIWLSIENECESKYFSIRATIPKTTTLIIEWGDGITETVQGTANAQLLEHTYSSIGNYRIDITNQGLWMLGQFTAVGSTPLLDTRLNLKYFEICGMSQISRGGIDNLFRMKKIYIDAGEKTIISDYFLVGCDCVEEIIIENGKISVNTSYCGYPKYKKVYDGTDIVGMPSLDGCYGLCELKNADWSKIQ